MIELINENLINELLDQATHLTKRKNTNGEISQADLRRAVSSAYYALFHFLILQSVNLLCKNFSLALKHKMCRTFQHGEMSKICMDFIKEIQRYEKELEFQKEEQNKIYKSNGKYSGKTITPFKGKYTNFLNFPINDSIKKMALIFPDMQEFRHEADYNLAVQLETINVLSKITEVKEAIKNWKKLRAKEQQENKNILLMLLFCKELKY